MTKASNGILPITGIMLCLSIVACGSGGKTSGVNSMPSVDAATSLASTVSSARERPGALRKGDADIDDEHGEDDPARSDDSPLTGYGKVAGAAETADVTATVKRYYTLAVAGDGAGACGLLYSRLAAHTGMTKTVPEDRFSRPVRAHIVSGESCAQVTASLFKRYHRRLVLDVPTLQVTGVRVKGTHGVALLGFNAAPEQWIPLAREGTVWKIHSLLALILP